MNQILSPATQALLAPVDQHLDALLKLVDEAGEQVMQVYQASEPVEVSLKADASPVTAADTRANTVLVAGLAKLFPELPIVSEEAPASFAHRHPSRPFWLLDPLDGTREFINRTDQFTVNVALVFEGRAVMGVVSAPALGELFWASATRGAYERVNNENRVIAADTFPIRLATGVYERSVRIVASQSHLSDETRQWIDQIEPHQLHQAGSSLKFCRLAQGRADCYPRQSPTCEWDTAAGQAILEIAGGGVYKLDGTPLAYGVKTELNPSFVATGAGAIWPLT